MDVGIEPSLLGNSKNLVVSMVVIVLPVEIIGTLSYPIMMTNNEQNVSLCHRLLFQVCQHAIMPGPFILKLRRSC